ncbi:SPOR domain-containing protein [Methyloversatilis sp. XJ19-49]|uniref:SPOR domain-containing protein n=1 Tax=Methyloversatilis sp. XJ19-49 TaxID=2963429 RepID=UPI00211CA79F|nr:SPOR domain-containing protein [Methyloversatilis sp. XJ19-49]MCQ9378126.1 SPOR domain-containing protein [Methyloversatilis sp. XJ19-49]
MSAAVARARLGVRSDAEEQAAEQRSALLRRVVVAGGLIALLIGGLALFDVSRKPAEPLPPSMSDVQSEPAVAEAEPPAEETALPPLPPADEGTGDPGASDVTAAEARTVNLPDTPPPLPEGTARPEAPAGTAEAEPAPAAAPATPGRLVIGDGEPRAPAATQRLPARAPAAQPITRTPPPAAAGQGEITGYRVQVGVFSSVANAEDVRAKLALKGIPSQIEARVHVGPFKTRAEADQARARLRALGMDSGAPAPVRAATGRP